MKGEATSAPYRLEIRKPLKARRVLELEAAELPAVGDYLRIQTPDEEGTERVLVTGRQEPAQDGKWILWGESVGIEL